MRVGALISLLLAAVAAVLGYFFGGAIAIAKSANTSDVQATIFVGYIAAAIALSTAIIAIWGVYSQRVLARRQATIEHLARLEADGTVKENVRMFIDLTAQDGNLGKWADGANKASKETKAIIAVLNDWELISIGIQRGIFEYELVKSWSETSIQRYWSKAHPFVVALRDRVGAQTLWQEFEKLNSWVSGRSRPLWSLWWTGFG
jgi:hypothetical protein